ncbi:hypothetical protein L7F22_004330 [Adiantum nelumboides]|nr:hypothetical protein [Adiantum nelumboides]
MGMHLFNVKRLFRRRKYEKVLGQAGQLDADHHVLAADDYDLHQERTHGKHQQHNMQMSAPQLGSRKSMISQESPSSSKSVVTGKGKGSHHQIWGFRMRSKLVPHGMTRQKSLKSAGSATASRTTSAVQKFLEGPPDTAAGDEEVYQQQCRDLLRKLSARGNRVPGVV